MNDEHSEVAKAADDYIWLKLCQIREEDSSETQATDRMTYAHLQSLILEEYGRHHHRLTSAPKKNIVCFMNAIVLSKYCSINLFRNYTKKKCKKLEVQKMSCEGENNLFMYTRCYRKVPRLLLTITVSEKR